MPLRLCLRDQHSLQLNILTRYRSTATMNFACESLDVPTRCTSFSSHLAETRKRRESLIKTNQNGSRDSIEHTAISRTGAVDALPSRHTAWYTSDSAVRTRHGRLVCAFVFSKRDWRHILPMRIGRKGMLRGTAADACEWNQQETSFSDRRS